MVDEILEYFDLEGRLIGEISRSEYYRGATEEFNATGKVSYMIPVVFGMLVSPKGELYLQRRSVQKTHNSGLIDKSIGGHIQHGFSADRTFCDEAYQEFRVNTYILDSGVSYESFVKEANYAYRSCQLHTHAVCTLVDRIFPFKTKRVTSEGNTVVFPFDVSVYFGYVDRNPKVDGEETSDYLITKVDELELAVRQNPRCFTDDLHVLLSRYRHLFAPLDFYEIAPIDEMKSPTFMQ